MPRFIVTPDGTIIEATVVAPNLFWLFVSRFLGFGSNTPGPSPEALQELAAVPCRS
jgi:hypothetical protein